MEPVELKFTEAPHFYEVLDTLVAATEVIITFGREKPAADSDLWKRLKKCEGWDRVEAELVNVGRGQPSPLASMIAPSLKSTLTRQSLSGMETAVIISVVFAVWSAVMLSVWKGVHLDVEYDHEKKKGRIRVNKKKPEARTARRTRSTTSA